MAIAETILWMAGAYAAIGLIVGVAFVVAGVSRVDHAAAGARWGFRLMILPGAAALWPLVLRWWVRAARRSGGHA